MCENTERRILSTPVCLSADTQIFATQVLNWQTHSTHGKMGDTAKPVVKVLNEQTTASKSEIKATDLAKKLQKTMLRWFIFFILCQHWVLGGWVGGVLFLPRNVLYCHGIFSGVFFCLFVFFFLWLGNLCFSDCKTTLQAMLNPVRGRFTLNNDQLMNSY